MTEWISVKHLPPENEWLYLASKDFDTITWGIFYQGKFQNPDLDYLEIRNVTHWMPLPKPPEAT